MFNMNLPQYIKEKIKLSHELEEYLKIVLVRKELAKGHHLFKQGDVCHQVFFIEKGFARVYYISNSGKEITAWFSAENNFVTPLDTFYQQKATRDNCELLEDSVVYSFKYSVLETLLNNPESGTFAFLTSFEIAKKMSEYLSSIKFQTAEERYNSLMQNHPSVFQRASLGHIASYLGITQETLSRIRSCK